MCLFALDSEDDLSPDILDGSFDSLKVVVGILWNTDVPSTTYDLLFALDDVELRGLFDL